MSFLESNRKANASSQVLIVENDPFGSELLDHAEQADDEWANDEWATDEYPLYLEIYGTGLHLATYFGLHVYVDAMLGSSVATPDPVDKGGRTPLSWAAERGHEAIITLLLAKGASVETKDNEGRSPLSWAAAEGREAVVELLVDNEADVKSKDNQGRTPIYFATFHGHEGTVAFLLDKGADVESTTKYSRTPLTLAAQGGFETIVKLLLQRGAHVESSHLHDSALSEAMNGHRVGVAKLLFDHGAQVSAVHLFRMSSQHCRAMVELLDCRGADIEARDKQGRTPLSLAVQRGYSSFLDHVEGDAKTKSPRDRCLDVVKYLLDRGVDIETTDDQGRTPLSWAAERGFVVVVQMLLEHGADVESRDKRGRTPLLLAVQKGRGMAAAQLIDQGGACFEPSQADSVTQLLFAVVQGRMAVEILLDKRIDAVQKQASTQRLTENGPADVVEILIDMAADIESRDEQARTPLSWAAEKWDEASIKVLLDKGADAESADEQGWTPLLLAAGTEHDPEIEWLLGPDPDPDEPGDAKPRGGLDCCHGLYFMAGELLFRCYSKTGRMSTRRTKLARSHGTWQKKRGVVTLPACWIWQCIPIKKNPTPTTVQASTQVAIWGSRTGLRIGES